MVEYTRVLLNRYEVGKDGKTAYERLRGRILGVEFGELLHFRRSILGDGKDKFDSLWEDFCLRRRRFSTQDGGSQSR